METKAFFYFNESDGKFICLEGNPNDLVNMICKCMNENETIEQIILNSAKSFIETKKKESDK